MLRLGFDDVIGKPFELPKLLGMVGRLLELEVDSVAPARAEVAPASAVDLTALPAERVTLLSNAIREALDLGDIGVLTVLGEELEAEGGPVADVGRKLRALGEAFDFDGLARLNAQLTGLPSKG
jgi:hypothetical protein